MYNFDDVESGAIDKVMATGDGTAIDLLEKFLDLAQESYSRQIGGNGDGLQEVMPALYALNRHLVAHYPEKFPSGFFAGNESELHEYVRTLLASIFRSGPGALNHGYVSASRRASV